MKISHDGTTVSFKTEPEEFFFAEKSGEKSNIVRILDKDEYQQLRKAGPKKIIVQYEQEVFLRTLTHICIAGEALGKVIVIFSWEHRPESSETDHLSSDVLTAPSQDRRIILIAISKGMFDIMEKLSNGRSTDAVIRELYQTYLDNQAYAVRSKHE